MNIQFRAEGQDLVRLDKELIASGAVQSLIANFEFDEEWEQLSGFARFFGAKGQYDMKIYNNQCKVPWEVIEHPYFEMCLIGTGTDESRILTTKRIFVKVHDSIDTYDFEPLPDSPDIIAQYDELIRHADEVAQRLLEWAAEGRFDGKDGQVVISEIDFGFFAVYIDPTTGHLMVVNNDDDDPIPLSIDENGHLIYSFEEQTKERKKKNGRK